MAHQNNPNTAPENHLDIPIDDGLEIMYSVVNCLGTVIVGILCIIHFYKTFSDLYTQERKSLAHRRKLPKIDMWYKLASFFTCLHLLGNCLSLLFFSIAYTSTQFCFGTTIGAVGSYLVGKGAMYSVFFIRLVQVYGESAYAYNKKLIIGIIVFCNAFFIFTIMLIIVNKYNIVYVYDNDGKIPEYCIGFLFLTGMITIFQDVILTIGSMIAFIVPLRKTINAMGDDKNEKIEAKMVFIGTKVTILSITATISTLVFVGLILLTTLAVLQVFDAVVNSICLMFMTAYYPDNKYYQKWCILCIACCDRKRRSYESNAADENRQNEYDRDQTATVEVTETTKDTQIESQTNTQTNTNVSSVDTMDQVKVQADKTNPNGDQLL